MDPRELYQRIDAQILQLEHDKNVQFKYDPKIVEILKNQFENPEKQRKFMDVLKKFHPSDRSFLEHQMRIAHHKEPENALLPQIGSFLVGLPAGAHAPRHPFSLPSFYYHVTPPGASLTTQTHSQEFLVPHEYIGQVPRYRISNGLVQLFDADMETMCGVPDGFGQSPHYKMDAEHADTFSTEAEHSGVDFEGARIELKNGRICSSRGTVERTQRLLKAKFHVAGDLVEVLALTDTFTVVGGALAKTPGSMEHSCILNEIPGTYGTTDFLISPDFRCMLRMSKLRPLGARKMSNVQGKLKQNRRKLAAIVPLVQKALDTPRDWSHFHTDPADYGMAMCQVCNVCASCGERLLGGGVARLLRQRTEAESWTPREKVVYLASLGPLDTATVFGDREKCKFAKRIVDFARAIVDGTFRIEGDFEEELLAEYSFQLIFAVTGVYTYLLNHTEMTPVDKSRVFCSMNFLQYYMMPAEDIFKYIEFASLGLSMVLIDLVCQRATPLLYNRIIELYRKHPMVVARAIQKYPHIVLFGMQPVRPPVRLIEIAGKEVHKSLEAAKEERGDTVEAVDAVANQPVSVESEPDKSEPARNPQPKSRPKAAQRLFQDIPEEPEQPDEEPEIDPRFFTPHTIRFDEERPAPIARPIITGGRRSTAEHLADFFDDSDDDDDAHQPSTSTRTPNHLKRPHEEDPTKTPTTKISRYAYPHGEAYTSPVMGGNSNFEWKNGKLTPKKQPTPRESPATRSSRRKNSDWITDASRKLKRR